MIPLSWEAKDPDETEDYTIDWRDRLGCDTIEDSDFSLATAAGLIIDDQSHTRELSTVRLAAGTEGSKAKVLCEVTTSSGRVLQQTVSLLIKAR